MGLIWKSLKQQVKFDRNYMPGFTPRSINHHYSLYTIWGCNVVGFAWCFYFIGRTLVYNPDSLFVRKDNYNRYRDGTDFKLVNITGYRPPSHAPEYRREGDPPDESYALSYY